MEMTHLSWILTFLLGGTNVWTIVMYALECKKRALEHKSAQADIDDKEFETLRKQLEYQDTLISRYETKLHDYDDISDELRRKLFEIKRQKYESEKLVLKLRIKYDSDACLDFECRNRILPNTNQKQENGNKEI